MFSRNQKKGAPHGGRDDTAKTTNHRAGGARNLTKSSNNKKVLEYLSTPEEGCNRCMKTTRGLVGRKVGVRLSIKLAGGVHQAYEVWIQTV